MHNSQLHVHRKAGTPEAHLWKVSSPAVHSQDHTQERQDQMPSACMLGVGKNFQALQVCNPNEAVNSLQWLGAGWAQHQTRVHRGLQLLRSQVPISMPKDVSLNGSRNCKHTGALLQARTDQSSLTGINHGIKVPCGHVTGQPHPKRRRHLWQSAEWPSIFRVTAHEGGLLRMHPGLDCRWQQPDMEALHVPVLGWLTTKWSGSRAARPHDTASSLLVSPPAISKGYCSCWGALLMHQCLSQVVAARHGRAACDSKGNGPRANGHI